jgi:hypothetical protein
MMTSVRSRGLFSMLGGIEAHSLVQDWDELTHYAEGSFNVRIDISGVATVTQKRPEDEEAFESLAARVRPLTLDREPIHYKKVVRALSRLIDAAPAATDHQRTWLERLRQACRISGRPMLARVGRSSP